MGGATGRENSSPPGHSFLPNCRLLEHVEGKRAILPCPALSAPGGASQRIDARRPPSYQQARSLGEGRAFRQVRVGRDWGRRNCALAEHASSKSASLALSTS